MTSRRAYRRCDVKKIDVDQLRDLAVQRGGSGTTVGLDIGKDEMVVCLRWPNGDFERPWNVANTAQIGLLLERLTVLKEVCDSLTIGMESTGTYGEAIRQAMTQADLEVHRISGKATSDYQEIFDGVPSQHDGKDAAIVAELTAFGKGRAWPFEPDSLTLQQVKHQVRRIDCYRLEQVRWLGRLEGMQAKHWPELTKLLKLASVTLLELLAHYESAGRVAADANAAKHLRKWGGTRLGNEKIVEVLESARTTRGVPPNASESAWIGEVAGEALVSYRRIQECEKALTRLIGSDEKMSRYVAHVGGPTLSVIWATVGDPRDYDSSGSFLKALGLNLKERSSGRRRGQLAITKRGPALARRWIFYWALRAIQREELRPWYEAFTRVGRATSGKQENRKMKGVVAMMRKLCRGLWHAMQHAEDFDYGKILEEPPRRKRRRRPKRRAASVKTFVQ